MGIVTYDDPTAFYARVTPFLMAHEAENNVLLGLREALENDPDRYERPFLMASIEQAGEIVAVVMRTPPYALQITTLTDPTLLAEIAALVRRTYGSLNSAVGQRETVLAFAQVWGQPWQLVREQRLYKLEAVRHPQGIRGEARPATEEYTALIEGWFLDFEAEALHSAAHRERIRRQVARYLKQTREYGTWLWFAAGEPVSLVSYKGPTPNSIRIGPVYTPPAFRRQGYGTACTAAVSQFLLDEGYAFCTLYTDLANPTSNSIYQAVGYEPIEDSILIDFVGGAG